MTKGLSERWAAAPPVKATQSVQILRSPTRLPSVVTMGKTPQHGGGLRPAMDCNRLMMIMMMIAVWFPLPVDVVKDD